jgi:hypothetical protein
MAQKKIVQKKVVRCRRWLAWGGGAAVQAAVGVLLGVLFLASLVMWGLRARMRRAGCALRQAAGSKRDTFDGRL